jgi:galacturan 1,4-alpha-galacturonidase
MELNSNIYTLLSGRKNWLVILLYEKIDGTIMPPDGPESWPSKMNKRQWLVFYKINGMSMQGGGVIDGRGEKWWNLPCKPHKVSH